MMKHRNFFLSALAMVAAPFAQAAVPAEAFPEDTLLYLSLDNWQQFCDTLTEGALGAAYENGGLRERVEAMIPEDVAFLFEDSPEKAEVETLSRELFPGGVAMAILPHPDWPADFSKAPKFLVMAEISDKGQEGMDELDEAILRLWEEHGAEDEELFDEDAEAVEEDFLGYTIVKYVDADAEEEKIDYAYTIYKNLLAVSDNVETLRSFIEQMEDGTATMAQEPAYQEALSYVEQPGMLAFINFRRIVPFIDVAVHDFQQENQTPAFQAQAFYERLRLDVLRSLFFNVDYAAEQPNSISALLYDERKGLLELVAVEQGDLPRPGFVPEDVLQLSTGNFDLAAFITTIEEMFTSASPMASTTYQMQLESAKSLTGIDVRGNLLESLGTGYIYYKRTSDDADTALEMATPGQIFAFKLQDPGTFEMTIEAVKSAFLQGMDLFEEQEYLGERFFKFKQRGVNPEMQDANQIGYAVVQDYFILSMGFRSHQLLRESIAEMQSDRVGLLGKGTMFDKALMQMPPGAIAADYVDAQTFVNYMVAVFEELTSGMTVVRKGTQETVPEKEPKPLTLDLPYISLTTSYIEPNAMISRARFFSKKELGGE